MHKKCFISFIVRCFLNFNLDLSSLYLILSFKFSSRWFLGISCIPETLNSGCVTWRCWVDISLISDDVKQRRNKTKVKLYFREILGHWNVCRYIWNWFVEYLRRNVFIIWHISGIFYHFLFSSFLKITADV
jgi:hypothetical protein